MKRFIFTMISSCVMLFAAAQEEIALDSIRNNQKDFDTRQMILLRPTLSDDTFTSVD
jgi:hypothetical protein